MKHGKKLMAFVLAMVMAFGLIVSASAAESITVQLRPDVTVKLDNKTQVMTDTNGSPVYPIMNGGTTYLPVRAVSNMLGINVDWDAATQTILLDTSKTAAAGSNTTAKTGASAKVADITVQLRPDVTVKLDNKTQAMADANGSTVYPIMNGGTTYLPVRAVSNMLGINVDWDGATQTVLLNSGNNAADNGSVIISPDSATVDKFFKEHGLTGVTESTSRQISISDPSAESIRKSMKRFGYPDYAIESAISEFEAKGPNNGNGTFTYEVSLNKKDTFKTSEDAKVIDNAHVTNDYVEIDLSTASNGYVKVRLTKPVGDYASCSVDRANITGETNGFDLKPNQWANGPLTGGNDYYQLTVDSELHRRSNFNVAFIANIKNPDAWMLLSHNYVDFENAPKTVAKAAELTKNCKTNAEKITVIFNWVATNIKYDYNAKIGESQGRSLDDILDSKTGICVNYAALMAGMLRSQGVPCKVIKGQVYKPETGWCDHAWVSVSPDTKGLDMQRLGAGHDEDGWIRLDPTWGGTASSRADAAVDKNHKSEYAY